MLVWTDRNEPPQKTGELRPRALDANYVNKVFSVYESQTETKFEAMPYSSNLIHTPKKIVGTVAFTESLHVSEFGDKMEDLASIVGLTLPGLKTAIRDGYTWLWVAVSPRVFTTPQEPEFVSHRAGVTWTILKKGQSLVAFLSYDEIFFEICFSCSMRIS